jgi:hypothetical protein
MSIKEEICYSEKMAKELNQIEEDVSCTESHTPKFGVLTSALYVERGLEKADSVLLFADTAGAAMVNSARANEFFKHVCKLKYKKIQSHVGPIEEIMELFEKMADTRGNWSMYTKAGTEITDC